MSVSSNVSRICLGTAQLGLDYGVANTTGRPDDVACEALLSRAVERGVVHLDTARAYGDAEQRLGRFLAHHPRRDEIHVVSKLPAVPTDLPHNQLLDWVTSEIDISLHNLRIDRLSGWLIHDVETVRNYGDAIWDAMKTQVDRGVTARMGMSVYDVAELRLAFARTETDVVQVPLNLLDHRFVQSGLLDEAMERGTAVYARSALLQGTLAMPTSQLPAKLLHLKAPLQRLHDALVKYQLTPLDVALPFVLAQPQVDFVVIGVDNVLQLDDTLARVQGRLPDGLSEELCSTFTDAPAEVLEPRRW